MASAQNFAIPTNLPGTVTYAVPAGFNPSTATDADLAAYGFPPRPNSSYSPQAYAVWLNFVSSPNRLQNPQLVTTGTFHGPAQNIQKSSALRLPSFTTGPQTTISTTTLNSITGASTDNWSGIVFTDASGTWAKNNAGPFSEIIIPIAQQPFGVCSSTAYHTSIWDGVDGYNGNDVLQTGVEAIATCSSQTYYAWYEWYPNAEVQISNFPVGPGDVLAIQVWYTPNQQYLGHAYLNDYSTNTSVVLAFNPPAGTTLAGTSVEWIVETPGVGGQLAQLTNYMSVPYNYVYATDGLLGSSGTNVWAPGSDTNPATSTEINVTLNQNNYNLSYVNVTGTYALQFYDEGPAECTQQTGCTNPGTNLANTYNN